MSLERNFDQPRKFGDARLVGDLTNAELDAFLESEPEDQARAMGWSEACQ